MNKKPLKGMYQHYAYKESPSGYKDEHFEICLKLMTQYDIKERLGLDVMQLADMDPDRIKQIEDFMINYTKRTSEIVNTLNNTKDKELHNATRRRRFLNNK